MGGILAIESGGALLSVAACAGAPDSPWGVKVAKSPQSHDEGIAALVTDALSEAGLTWPACSSVVVGAGPGSFTGLRIGYAFAKGVCAALKIPLVTIETPRAVGAAWMARNRGKSCAASQAALSQMALVVSSAGRNSYYVTAVRLRREGVLAEVVVPASVKSEPQLDELALSLEAILTPEERPVRWLSGDGERLKVGAHDVEQVVDVARGALALCLPQGVSVGAFGCHNGYLELSEAAPQYVRAAEAKTIAERSVVRTAAEHKKRLKIQ